MGQRNGLDLSGIGYLQVAEYSKQDNELSHSINSGGMSRIGE
jgi:hypothetical protein